MDVLFLFPVTCLCQSCVSNPMYPLPRTQRPPLALQDTAAYLGLEISLQSREVELELMASGEPVVSFTTHPSPRHPDLCVADC